MDKYQLICISGFIMVILSCSSGRQPGKAIPFEQYRDSVFLKIEGDLQDPEVIWGSKDTYLRSLDRMERYLWIENNRLKWNVTKGKDIKISDNIYAYIVDAWKLQNARLDSGRYKLKGKIAVPNGEN